jgi:hypothetical protein
MSRRAREISGTGIYHVMMRGINRQNIFEDDESKGPVPGVFSRKIANLQRFVTYFCQILL